MIRFNSVSKKYKKSVVALEDINFSIEDGEFVFLVGPSGAGKTTLLKLIIGEIKPTHGSVHVDYYIVSKLAENKLPYLRRKVSFVFQDFKLLAERTVVENISVSLEILGKTTVEAEKRIEAVLSMIKLSDKGNYFPRQLSYGEQQRVAIGRAIAGEAKILLADEPTGNLDPKTSWEILKIISAINKDGKTVIMATHNVDIVNSLKKRVIVIKDGKIIKDEKKGSYS